MDQFFYVQEHKPRPRMAPSLLMSGPLLENDVLLEQKTERQQQRGRMC